MNRRTFITGLAAAPVWGASQFDVAAFDRARVLRNARKYLASKPETVTILKSPRSSGGPHDFFSEGDYWWQDPKNPDGPYIRRDGMTNPDNFVAHRTVLMKFSVQVPALAAAWKLSQDRKYADHAAEHVRAWFVRPATRMNPDLQYAQAIHGVTPGRGTGIIDTIHLVEVARAIPLLLEAKSLSALEHDATLNWFSAYTNWMMKSKNGKEEGAAKNNHGTCWLMQLAAFAQLTGNRDVLKYSAERFKQDVVPEQVAPDGSLPLEMARTKPYGYCLFDLEALATLCQIVSEQTEDLWNFTTTDGRGVGKAIEYMFPYIRDKKSWPKPPDVMYFDKWPMRQEALLFGGRAYNRTKYIELWKTLPADSDVEEVIRNYFIRQPVLWTS